MKILLTLLGVMAFATAYAQSTTTITFGELPNQAADGLTFKGVTFRFQIGGTNSTDAHFNGSGPGTLTYVSDPSLEGNGSGVLGFDFAVPVSHVSFGVALLSTSTLTPGITVDLFDADLVQVNKILLTTRPLPTFSEGLFTEDGGAVSHVSIFFNNTAPRFVVDNLTFTSVPEPSVAILTLAGLLLLVLHRGARSWLAKHWKR